MVGIGRNTSKSNKAHDTHRQAMRASLTRCTLLSLGSIQALEGKRKTQSGEEVGQAGQESLGLCEDSGRHGRWERDCRLRQAWLQFAPWEKMIVCIGMCVHFPFFYTQVPPLPDGDGHHQATETLCPTMINSLKASLGLGLSVMSLQTVVC